MLCPLNNSETLISLYRVNISKLSNENREKKSLKQNQQKGSYAPSLDETFFPQTFLQYKSLQSACHMLLVILDYNLVKLDALFLFISVHCQA